MWSIISSELGLKFVAVERSSRRKVRKPPALGSAAVRTSSSDRAIADLIILHYYNRSVAIQGGLDPNKISGLGVDFGNLVRCLLLGNKDAACKPSMIFR